MATQPAITVESFGGFRFVRQNVDFTCAVGVLGEDHAAGRALHDVREVADNAQAQLPIAVARPGWRKQFQVFACGERGLSVRAKDSVGGRERRTERKQNPRLDLAGRLLRRADAIPRRFFCNAAIPSAYAGGEAIRNDEPGQPDALAQNQLH